MAEYLEKINILTRQYNDAITALQESYDMESAQGFLQNLSSSRLKRQYSKKYEALAREYQGKKKAIFEQYKKEHPEWTKSRKIWGWIFYIGYVCAIVCCSAAMPMSEEPTSAVSSQAVSSQESTAWNAENIPIPFLQDSTQYVSNPDHVLSQETVNRMNVTLKRLDNELGVQPCVIVVNYIENDDPFRFAQDVGNKYGVGYGNKGLMVVVGYLDHSINISPGRALEADLTDAECHRLEQAYAVPSMKAEMPDSAMYYLTEALYSTLKKKELPPISNLTSDIEDEQLEVVGITMLAIIIWCVFFLRINRKYHWLGMAGAASLMANPFYEATHSSGGGFGGFSGGGGHFGGGGGGFSGGHFGGGSFGGGGATSRW